MPCIETQNTHRPGSRSLRSAGALGLPVALAALVLLAACANKPAPAPGSATPVPAAAPAAANPTAAFPPSTAAAAALPNAAQPMPAATASLPAAKAGAAPRYITLGPAAVSRNWNEVRLQAARRMVAAHPDTSHMGKPQPLLLGIPVLEIELNSDGSVRKVVVLREPQEAKETIQLAIDAVRRAGPYGDVSRLPKPWKFIETFLFNSDRRFKPRSLD